jgi:hypothetical protein
LTVNTYDFEGSPAATISGTGISLLGTGQAVYDTGVAAVGSTGAKFTATAGQTRSALLDATTPSLTMGLDAIITLPTSLPGSGVRYSVMTARRSGGVAATVQYDQNGQLVLVTTGRIDAFSATGLAAGSKVRVQLLLVVVSGTSSTAVAKAYTGSSWTTQSGTTFTSGAVLDMGSAAINQANVGALTAATPGLVVGADYVRLEDGRTTDFSAPPATGAPTAIAAASNTDPEVSTQVTLSAAVSNATGGVLWACTARPEGSSVPQINNPTSSSTATVTPDTNGVYDFTITATGGVGTTPATSTVTVYAYQHSSQGILIRSVDATTTWTNEGGAATYTTALNDTSTVTAINSPDGPTTSDIVKGTLAPAGPGTNKFQVWASCTTGTATITVQVRDATDATVIQETIDSAIGTTEKLVEVVLQSDDLAAYSFASGARRALRFRWFATTP